MAPLVLEASRDVVERISRTCTPLDNGYFRVLGGALGAKNSEGRYYKVNNAVVSLFSVSSSLMRRVKSAALFAEVNHPKREPGQTDEEFMDRWCDLDKRFECGHIRKVELESKARMVEGQAKPIFPVWIEIKPQGPYGEALLENLTNKEVNVAFSVRTISKRGQDIDGTLIRLLLAVITYDWVNEPGINVATQATTGLLKGESITEIDDTAITGMINFIERNSEHLKGEERDKLEIAKEVLSTCGDGCIYNDF